MISKASLLIAIPDELRLPLLEEYGKIVRNFRERRWEPAELNGGKLCEIVYSIIKGHVDGKFPSGPSKPNNMVDACRDLEKADPNTFNRSIRIQIPRILVGLYEIRNNRGVGHTGGDVNPNEMDAAAVLAASKWLLSELIRFFHSVSPQEASSAVSVITERTVPIVWEIDGKKRILDPKLSQKDKTLLLLYSCQNGASEKDLFKWTEHSNSSVFRRDILRKLHVDRLIEFDEESSTAKLSPRGTLYVEKELKLDFTA